MLTEPIRVTLLVVGVLKNLNIPYFVGGSLATAIHGVARATMDVDLIADVRAEHAQPLVDALGPDFYADTVMIRDAVRGRSSFNVIHKPTMFKVDVFISKGRPFDRSQFARRVAHSLTEDGTDETYLLINPGGSSGRSPTVPVVARSGDRPQQVRPRKIEKRLIRLQRPGRLLKQFRHLIQRVEAPMPATLDVLDLALPLCHRVGCCGIHLAPHADQKGGVLLLHRRGSLHPCWVPLKQRTAVHL
jgi:hypothetical protein